jgi:tripartite motif-containing protein 71
LNLPESVAVDSSGCVYVTDTGNNRIQKFSNDDKFIKTWGSHGSTNGQFIYPSGVAVDPSDCIYVTDANSSIQKFSNDGKFITKWTSNYAQGVAVDYSGNVYVTGEGVQVFAPPHNTSV